MSSQKEEIDNFQSGLDKAFDVLGILRKREELAEYEKEMSNPKFWEDSVIAQAISKNHGKLQAQIKPWLELAEQVQEVKELTELKDPTLVKELDSQLEHLKAKFAELEFELKFSGEYDDHDAIVTIQTGAGGTDAADWAQMLLRMYLRWSESNNLKTTLIEETPADEAGIKNATLDVSGPYAYGKLRGEHGVHRLVRLSPFNTAHSRETSFAMVEVVPKIDEPDEVEIDEKDLRIDTFRASGHGGQSVNTTDSAVRITHEPTGLTVSIQNEKSQIQNKETALKILRSKLAQLKLEQHADKIADLKGPNVEAAWGNQIRNYVMHPYTLVKDTRTDYQTSDVNSVLDGNINEFIESYLFANEQK